MNEIQGQFNLADLKKKKEKRKKDKKERKKWGLAKKRPLLVSDYKQNERLDSNIESKSSNNTIVIRYKVY